MYAGIANGNLHAIAIKDKKNLLKIKIIMRLYKLGSYGMEVRQIQAQLTKLGYYRSPVDGKFGQETVAAVCAFQRINKIAEDGKVGPQTWEMLFTLHISPSYTHDRLIDY